ncbi:MAG: PIN domain-containing protein [Ignavibacteria bacterium]|nr:PIN domain-containing protein [Ignavibacteria bacterium]
MHTGLKLYFDTSVISAYFDSEKPQRQLITQKWFENEFDNFECYISDLVLEELEATKNDKKRSDMIDLTAKFEFIVLKLNPEIFELADLYMAKSKVLSTERSDAIHIACSTYFEVNNIASWNFKHFVNIEVIKDIHEVNKQLNYKITEIFSLLNLGGEKYG